MGQTEDMLFEHEVNFWSRSEFREKQNFEENQVPSGILLLENAVHV